MLFDLRGRGRRRTVQAIYLMLAVLMGGGLVFFGIGGSVSGGLFDAIGLTGGSSNQTSSSKLLEKQEQAIQRRIQANPRDAAAWAQLTRVRYQQAGQGDNYDQRTGQFTDGGRRELAQATEAWERYLALKPPRPNSDLAALMVQAYGSLGISRAAKGVSAAEIVAQARPSAQSYYQLAVFAYAAKQTRKAELAAAKALQLTPPDQRAQVKSQLDAIRQQVSSRGSATGGGSNARPSG